MKFGSKIFCLAEVALQVLRSFVSVLALASFAFFILKTNVVLAMPQFSIVGSPSLAVSTIQASELRAVFLGEKLFISAGIPLAAPIRVRAVRLEDKDPLTESFVEQILKMKVDQAFLIWRRHLFSGRAIPPKVAVNEASLAQYLIDNPNSLGYVASDSVKKFPTLHRLKLEGQ